MQEIEIDEGNFYEHFRDVRTSAPSRGDVIAQYTAMAEFLDGNEKRQIISLLASTENKMEATAQVMRKLLFASELDAYRIPRIIAEDLISGMSVGDVAAKPYKYTLEMFFYTDLANVPKDDPHWSCISLLSPEDIGGKILSHITSKTITAEQLDADVTADEVDHELKFVATSGDAGSV